MSRHHGSEHEDPHAPHRRRRGFTLIEIMVVITIIGLLMTLVARSVFVQQIEAEIMVTRGKLATVANTIATYRRHHHRVPDSLEVLLEPGPLGRPYAYPIDLRDAWEQPLRYTRLSNSRYQVISLGADGLEGGEHENADLVHPDDFRD